MHVSFLLYPLSAVENFRSDELTESLLVECVDHINDPNIISYFEANLPLLRKLVPITLVRHRFKHNRTVSYQLEKAVEIETSIEWDAHVLDLVSWNNLKS